MRSSGGRGIVSEEDDSDPLGDFDGDDVPTPRWTPTADDVHASRTPSRGVVEAVSERLRIPYEPARFPAPPPVPRELAPWYARWWRKLWR
jgi:hypothetical protein